jgi:hypothetical protein
MVIYPLAVIADVATETTATLTTMTITLGIATPIVTRTATSPDWIAHGTMEDVAHVVAEADRLGYDICTCSEHIGIPDAESAAMTSVGSARTSARALAHSQALNDVLVSSTLRDLVIGSGLEFEERGSYELKGVPGEWHHFAVASP